MDHDPAMIRAFAARLAVRLGLEGEVRCDPWREGASNAVWKLDIGTLGAVLKVGKLPDWRRLGLEASVLRQIAGRGGPRQIAEGLAGDDLPWDWSLQERIEGHHPYQLTAASARELGTTLARLRGIQFNSDLTFQSWREFVTQRIRSPVSRCKTAPNDIHATFSALLEDVERCAFQGDALDALPIGVVHGDLIPLNILEKADGSIWVLDWENPRLGSACWDLAGVRKAFHPEPAAWQALLESVGTSVPPKTIDFAEALQNIQVAAWRAETWWTRDIRTAGEFFLEEMRQELADARRLLDGIGRG